MKKWILFMTIITVLFSINVYAEEDSSGQFAPKNQNASISIEYYDDSDMTIPVEGSTWTLVKIADIETISDDFIDGYKIIPLINYKIDNKATADEVLKQLEYKIIDESNISISGETIDGLSLEILQMTTDESGLAKFDELEYGVYLGIETKAARYHLCSTPFLVSVPHTEDDGITSDVKRTIMPKAVLAGDITIKKEVRGNAVSTTEEFEMKVKLPEGIYHYEYQNGKDGYIKNGETIKVADNNYVTIHNVMSEADYEVVEKIANEYGYKTEYVNAKGKILAKTDNQVKIINSRNVYAPVNTGTGEMFIISIGVSIISILLIIIIVMIKKRKGSDCK